MKMLTQALTVTALASAAVLGGAGTANASEVPEFETMGHVEYGGSYDTKAACEAKGNSVPPLVIKEYTCVYVVPHPTASGRWELFLEHWF